MKGSIRFNNAVNAEVDTDGSEITSVVNLVDGSSLSNNYVEVFEGTANELYHLPLTDSYAELHAKEILRDLTIVYEIDLTIFGGETLTINETAQTMGGGSSVFVSNILDSEGSLSGMIGVTNTRLVGGGPENIVYFSSLKSVTNGVITDMTAYAESIPVKTYIYHHPMPA